jgi:DNA-binding response OmpR family regulator
LEVSKILLLEDDQSIRSFVKINLNRNAFDVVEAATGEEALNFLKEHKDFDIAVLDVMLPGMSGFEVCKILRQNNPKIGILMLTAKSQEIDKILGLEYGADDYMTKPFSPSELVARVKALSRRVKINQEKYIEEQVHSEPFILNVTTRTCHKHAEEIILTPTEFIMLKIFIEHKGSILSREGLLEKIWGDHYVGDMKIVDVNIRRLRRKIEDDASRPQYLETVWGQGYTWKKG